MLNSFEYKNTPSFCWSNGEAILGKPYKTNDNLRKSVVVSVDIIFQI